MQHDPGHAAEGDLVDKGLRANAVGLFGSVMLGISCVAPAYTLTATIGILASGVGVKIPWVFIAGFLPMFFAAFAYREFNRVAPDSGTSFTWTTKAFGPWVGWLGGWAAILATIIVISNLASVAVQFFYQFIGSLLRNDALGSLWENGWINVGTCLAFLAIATWVAYRGIDTTEKVQVVLVLFQLGILALFAIMALAKAPANEGHIPFSWDWFSPGGLELSAFIAGLSGSIFAFWGWDSTLTVNEETKDAESTPGRAAVLTVTTILLTYLMVSVASLTFAGTSTEGLGLGNEEISSNVFGALAEPVMGYPLDLLLYLAVLASSAASLISTMLPTSRTMLAMAVYKAIPEKFAEINPKYQTPGFATVVAGTAAGVFYTVMYLLSQNVLTDTILSLGIMICFYYSLVAFGCVWFFRKELFTNLHNIVFKLLCPLLGGIGLIVVFGITLRDSASPDYGSGAQIGGVGLVLILGLGLILFGLVLMVLHRSRHPEFFRGETLRKDTPALVVD